MQAQSSWKNLGHLERKEKARLDLELSHCLQAWQTALDERRKEEVVSRHQLITEVTQLDPRHKTATEQLRGLQERWQAQASSYSFTPS